MSPLRLGSWESCSLEPPSVDVKERNNSNLSGCVLMTANLQSLEFLNYSDR